MAARVQIISQRRCGFVERRGTGIATPSSKRWRSEFRFMHRCLQVWWGYLILKAVYAMATGDEEARKNEAKNA